MYHNSVCGIAPGIGNDPPWLCFQHTASVPTKIQGAFGGIRSSVLSQLRRSFADYRIGNEIYFLSLGMGNYFFWGTLHPPASPQYSVAQEWKFSSFSVSNRNQGQTERRPSCGNVKSLRTYEIVYHMQTLRDEHVYVKRWLVRGLTEACHGVGPALPLSVKPRYILNGDAECCGR